MQGKSYRVYELSKSGINRIVQLVSAREGNRMVKRGIVEQGIDHDGVTACFCRKPSRKENGRMVRVSSADISGTSLSQFSCVAFSHKEIVAIAGTNFKHGRSRTKRLSEFQKAERVKQIYAERGIHAAMEDEVERATDKEDQWGKIGNLLTEVRTVESACL